MASWKAPTKHVDHEKEKRIDAHRKVIFDTLKKHGHDFLKKHNIDAAKTVHATVKAEIAKRHIRNAKA